MELLSPIAGGDVDEPAEFHLSSVQKLMVGFGAVVILLLLLRFVGVLGFEWNKSVIVGSISGNHTWSTRQVSPAKVWNRTSHDQTTEKGKDWALGFSIGFKPEVEKTIEQTLIEEIGKDPELRRNFSNLVVSAVDLRLTETYQFPVTTAGKASIECSIEGVFLKYKGPYQSTFTAEFDTEVDGFGSTKWLEKRLSKIFVTHVLEEMKKHIK